MKNSVPLNRVKKILNRAKSGRILVVGDVMLDHYVWGEVTRISPEAPVPVVKFDHESFMPGGAANVARNLAALGVQTCLAGVVGKDSAGAKLRELLDAENIDCDALVSTSDRPTSIKTRIIARQQQVVRLDREVEDDLDPALTKKLLSKIEPIIKNTDAVIVCDYGKGVIIDELLVVIKALCRQRGVWLSLDPKPIHHVDYSGFSLMTPNRKEAFELAGKFDASRRSNPLEDKDLAEVADIILARYNPGLLLITLGEWGMMLCRKGEPRVHIPTVAKEVYDVSGAGDTVIATFTAAIVGGASPLEAAVISNHAAGIVVGKIGTATASVSEILNSFETNS